MRIKISSFTIFLMIFFGCKRTKIDEKELIFKAYFKQAVFEKCLYYGFNGSRTFKELMKQNKGGGGEFIMYSDHIIDSIAKSTNVKMVSDSIASIGKVAEGSEGKHIISTCLALYTSKMLDSIAGVEYQKYKNLR
ncbi:MAG: hypothetical protein P0Y49_13400 [Candidatus Pedobacter colombiensis]|uniref:Lipoprotein n=1 Tax=Candidatus Pedobacter colombiensis TaxID=3121371 RepID=A0AAJ6B5H5_9SPHI|nr:hypothetical protein [Pedobacter sp.]WEK17794.1 MAG: hypothetical protein P0Y49_13400 [Pedobacter sp.]